jgi:outer membrane protein insertion porin family
MITTSSKLLLLLFFPSLSALPGFVFGESAHFAQLPASAHTLIEIKITGTKRFAPNDVIAASGLRTGITVSEDDFKKAARNLAETGAFSDIGYKYSYSSAGTKLELEVTDTDKFLPVHFEDFVWFSDEELRRAIKEHVPLFDGELPTSGSLPNEVSDALQTLLVEKGIAGHVDYVRAAEPSGQSEAFEYTASDVLIRVRKLEFTGAGASELPLLQAASEKLPDREYSRNRLALFAEKQLLPIYHARGYLKASFGPPQPKVLQPPPSAESDEETRNRTFVDVTFAVTPGQQYKLSRLEWSGNKVFPTTSLQSLIYAPIGQPLNSVRLADGLAEVRTLYGSRGYIAASIKADAQFENAASTVSILLTVKEGDAYHMGELEFRGLDNSLIAKLRAAWKLRPGDVYDATYLKQYLPQAHKLLPASLDWDVDSHVTANARDKSVDVDLVYSAKAPR